MSKESRKQLKELPMAREETVQENKVVLEYNPKENKYPWVLGDINEWLNKEINGTE